MRTYMLERVKGAGGKIALNDGQAVENPNQSTVTEVLLDLLTRHGLACSTEEEWVVPNGQLPAIRAQWHPRETSGRLDVHVLLGKDRIIEECFAGFGAGQPGFADAFNNFMVNSVHVLLSSLWGITHEHQVLTENWLIGGRQFTAHIGNFGRRTSAGVQVDIPKDLFETIRNRIRSEDLASDIHWFRVFFCNVVGQHSYEALRDNEPWEAGVEGLKGIAWPATGGFYSVRNFIVLRGV